MKRHFGSVDYLQLGIILVTFLLALVVNITYTGDQFVTHWDENGIADGYSSKLFILFTFPVMLLVFYLIFLLVPYISHHDDLEDFYDNYGGFRLAVITFLAIVFCSIILQNYGFTLNMNYIIIPAFASLFFYLGHILSVAKKNHYIGFRTSYTIRSDFVWKKTHQFSGFLFKSFAFISLLSLVFPQYFLLLFVIPLLVILIIILFYSKYVYGHYVAAIKDKDEHVKSIKRGYKMGKNAAKKKAVKKK